MTPPAGDGAEDSVRLVLTKNLTRSFSCPWCQVHGKYLVLTVSAALTDSWPVIGPLILC